MNDVNWARSRLRLAERARACREEGHDFLPHDPITQRRHCRRCPAYTLGKPDWAQLEVNGGKAEGALGWTAEKGMTFRHGPNPAWGRVKASLRCRGLIP